jgi:hypothetical protein
VDSAIGGDADVSSSLLQRELTPEASDVRGDSSDQLAVSPTLKLINGSDAESEPLLLSTSSSKAERQPSAAAAADQALVAGEWQPRPWHWGIYVWMYFLYFFYFELANRTLGVFNCVAEPLTDDRYLSLLPWLRCSSYASPSRASVMTPRS